MSISQVTLPRVFIVQINRGKTKEKDKTLIRVSTKLDNYEMKAMIMHWGNAADVGHYTCIVMGKAGKFLYCDDAKCEVHVKDSVQGLSENAACLIYVRKED